MSCLSLCGLRLFGPKRAISSPPSVNHEDDEEQPRPYSGSTAVGTSTGADAGLEEKDKGPGRPSRSRSVSQRLAVPVEAFTTALRDSARSRSRSKSLVPPNKPSEDDEKTLPSLPPSDDKPPRLSLDYEKTPPLSLGDGDEKAPRPHLHLVIVTGPAWPLKDDKATEAGIGPKQRLSAGSKRVNSIDSLDTPISPDFPNEEKKRVVQRLSTMKEDSKLRDEGLEVETLEETEEQARKRKMRESRQKLKMETPKDEQDRMDMFQCM
jgi:hypothetical protein